MFQENFGGDFDNKPQLSLSQPSKKKIKPHLPAESVGKRYVERFWHPFGAIVAPSLVEGAKPAWHTIDYYLQPSQLWKLHQDKSKLVGLRFNDTTRYATIDLDFLGDYHNIESINRIKAALEDIGIVDIIILQSSFSGGYHLILSFTSPLPTFALPESDRRGLESDKLIEFCLTTAINAPGLTFTLFPVQITFVYPQPRIAVNVG